MENLSAGEGAYGENRDIALRSSGSTGPGGVELRGEYRRARHRRGDVGVNLGLEFHNSGEAPFRTEVLLEIDSDRPDSDRMFLMKAK